MTRLNENPHRCLAFRNLNIESRYLILKVCIDIFVSCGGGGWGKRQLLWQATLAKVSSISPHKKYKNHSIIRKQTIYFRVIHKIIIKHKTPKNATTVSIYYNIVMILEILLHSVMEWYFVIFHAIITQLCNNKNFLWIFK